MRALFIAAASLLLGAACGLGSEGDPCTAPDQCEVGLNCYEGECAAPAVTCGPGTEEEEGLCVAPPRRQCGRGTIETNGVCVPAPADGS